MPNPKWSSFYRLTNSIQANPISVLPNNPPGSDGLLPAPLTRRIPELLSPAGDWECARAAVENGADAIYFGLEKFNARMRAHNFTEADLPKLMEFLHGRGVKGYVTFNTLVFENEMLEAEQYLRTMIASGVDAAIVQDVGICRLIRQLSPDFPIHVSTQMTITSLGGVKFTRQLGCNLVVLARECSLKEIGMILKGETSATAKASEVLPVEVFVHGALCVAYSGQCLTSEALGGRSANRGECAQACRLPYELIADGKLVPLGDRKYLLSPQDLSGLKVLPDLVRLKVASLKIEGRLKSPEYVANITRIYRQALDELNEEGLAGGSSEPPDWGKKASSPPAEEKTLQESESKQATDDQNRYEMEMAFSRGLYTGWFRGINNQDLVHGRFSKKRGVYLGKVLEVRREQVTILLESSLKPGDGVVFDAGNPGEEEEGGRVYGIKEELGFRRSRNEVRSLSAGEKNSKIHSTTVRAVMLSFGHGAIDFNRIHAGNRLWKTSDPELERSLRQSFAGNTPRFQRPVFFEVYGEEGKMLSVLARDEAGHLARADSTMLLVRAEQQPLTLARLLQQFGRLGGTPFKLGCLKNFLPDGLLLPVSELNCLRRELVRELQYRRAQPTRWVVRPQSQIEELKTNAAKPSVTPHSSTSSAKLHVLVRNLTQLESALVSGVDTLYCDFEDPKKYREAVNQFRSSDVRGSCSAIFVAPPRIFKMGEEWTLNLVRASGADGYLVRNYDHLEFFAKDRRVGDYSLNVANHLAGDYFKNIFNLERVTASYDLNASQLEALLQSGSPEWFEVTVHQHMPMFHMEHCVFCAFLSKGTDYTNCGRPCDTHDLKLRDRVGAEHPVKADAGCRNTVYHSRAQTGAEHVSRLMELGVRHFRLEFLNESAEEVKQTVSRYRRLLMGEISARQLWREMNLLNQLGVTRGQS